MKFGAYPVSQAEGGILAHTHRLEGRVLKKGRTLSSADIDALDAAGYAEVVIARLEPEDMGEDQAAAAIAGALVGSQVRGAEAKTGRVNLYAMTKGLLVIEREDVDALNSAHEAITLATLEPGRIVQEDDLIATVKIIPFGVARSTLELALAKAKPIRVAPIRAKRAGLILTTLPSLSASLLDRAEESQRARMRALGGTIDQVTRTEHRPAQVAQALGAMGALGLDPILMMGASAIVDRQDVLPTGLERAGGRVEHLGMPVDPGNLLMLGALGDARVIGIPGCARSLAPSGFDRVLERAAADLPLSGAQIMRMGAGGLMKDTDARLSPREPQKTKRTRPAVAAVLLAAGQSKRMGDRNKLLYEIEGRPMIHHALSMLQRTAVQRICVVLGHEAERVEAVVRRVQGPIEVRFTRNAEYQKGLSTSIRAGVDALATQPRVDGALFVLGDMPWVKSEDVDRLIDAFVPQGRSICIPVHRGRRGNPVLWAARYFADMQKLTGDTGARQLLQQFSDEVFEVPVSDRGVHFDVDTEEALEGLKKETGGLK